MSGVIRRRRPASEGRRQARPGDGARKDRRGHRSRNSTALLLNSGLQQPDGVEANLGAAIAKVRQQAT